MSNTFSNTTREELERGLRFAHVMMTVGQDQSNEAMAYFQALVDVLVEKGVLQPEELLDPLERAKDEIDKLMMPRVRLAEMGDKYTESENVEIDCASRLHLCHARCCSFKFFLTKQDLDEGIARWDYGNPYWIKQTDEGYCGHCDASTRACTIWAQRPHTCRKYDCRHDKRVWLDFENRIPAPMPDGSPNAPVAMAEVAFQNSLQAAEPSDGTKETTHSE